VGSKISKFNKAFSNLARDPEAQPKKLSKKGWLLTEKTGYDQ